MYCGHWIKQGRIGFVVMIRLNQDDSSMQMLAILNKPTFIESVEDIRLPLQSGTVFARQAPSPNENSQ